MLSFSGTQVNYFFVCTRKLWLFSHNIDLESDSDLVLMGRLLHETSYIRKTREVNVGRIKIDFLERRGEVHEIKRSRRVEKAHLFQLLYYLYYLKKHGVSLNGVLHYPLLRQTVKVELTEQREIEVEKALQEIESIVSKSAPPPASRRIYCKKCSYYELCYS